MLEQIRDHNEIGRHWASLPAEKRPQLSIGAPPQDFLEKETSGRRVWVGGSVMDAFLYGISSNPLATTERDAIWHLMEALGLGMVDQLPTIASGVGYTDDVFDVGFRTAHNKVQSWDVTGKEDEEAEDVA